MEVIINSLRDKKKDLHYPALTSLISISKKSDVNTLKLLNDNKTILTDIYNSDNIQDENKRILADILSLVYILSDTSLSITYRMLGNKIPVSEFGHQYIKKLLGTIAANKKAYVQEYINNNENIQSVVMIIAECVKFLFEHNCEVDGIDFLFEFDLEIWIGYFVDSYNFDRVFAYLSEIYFYDSRAYRVMVDMLRKKRMWVRLVIFMNRERHDDEYYDINEEMNANTEDSIVNVFDKFGKLFPVDLTYDGCDLEFTYENMFNKKLFYYKTEEKKELYFLYILSKCDWNEFLQIVFILNRVGNFQEKEIIQIYEQREDEFNKIICDKGLGKLSSSVTNDDNVNNVKDNNNAINVIDIMNNNYLSVINEYLHADLQVIPALPIEKFIKGIPKIDSEVTLRYFAPLSISNAFVHLGFGFDTLLFTQDSEYNVDLTTITDTDKLELLSIIGSLGLIKKNRKMKLEADKNNNNVTDNKGNVQDNASNVQDNNKESSNSTDNSCDNTIYNKHYPMYDELLESFAFQDSFSYKKSASLLALSLQQNKYDSDHSLFAFLSENLNSNCRYMKISSLLAIFCLYADSQQEIVKSSLVPLLYSENVETSAFSCFVLASVFMSSGNQEIADNLMTVLLEKKNESESPFYLLIPLSIGLLYMNKEIPEEMDEFLKINKIEGIVYGLSYMGSGRTDVIEEMVSEYVLGDEENENNKNNDESNNTKGDIKNDKSKREDEKTKGSKSNVRSNEIGFGETEDLTNERTLILLGITLISLNDMHTRSIAKKLLINQLMKDKNLIIPLCLGILYTSEPDTEIVDALSRAINVLNPINAILATGLVGAGTNNARLQGLLEQQYTYLTKNAKASGALKIAQGLLSLGKGTLSLSPLMFDKTVINNKSIASLLCIAMLSSGELNTLFSKHSYLLLILSQCVSNKFVVTMDEHLKFKTVTIRVGRPVETAAMAGKRTGISAVVTHDSPVILQCDEKAAIYEEEGYVYNGVVEDVVIVRKK
ncbi:proteasome regulatory particle base subunit [Binucleata daphniae]